jgi:hypothetical protein
MLRTMHLNTSALGLLLAATLPLIPATSSAAEPASIEASAPASDALQELEEILVRGEKLKNLITDAEDEFFDLFNDVNTDDDYDTSCVYLNLDTEGASLIKSRVCIPGFVADAIAQSFVSKSECSDFATFDGNFDGRISWDEATGAARIESDAAALGGDADTWRMDLKALFTSLDRNHDGYLSVMEYSNRLTAATPSNCYQPPPPQLVLMEGTQKWYEHSMQVINSDARLQKMAAQLDDLYHELFEEESRLRTAHVRRDAERVPVVAKPNPGPRVR